MASAASGLVSVPTTHASGVTVEAQALLEALGGFRPDPKASMLPRLRRAVGFAARAHAVSEKGHRSDVAWMVTLTYAGDNDAWKPEHMTTCMNRARDWCKRSGFAFRYVWVAELQKRGVIHYHVVLWLPRGVRPPKFDVRGWWPHGMTQRMRCKHATGYVMSYLKKGSHDGVFPKGSRRYGVGGLDHSLRRARRWLGLPAFVQARSDIGDEWKRATGGGWTAPDGSHYPSEWTRTYVGGAAALLRVHQHGRPFEAQGPFSWLHRSPVAGRRTVLN